MFIMTEYLILGLPSVESIISLRDVAALTEGASGSWRISLQKIGDIETTFLIFKGWIIAEYLLNSKSVYDYSIDRKNLDSTIVNDSKFIDRFSKYKTASPASTIDSDVFLESITN